MTMTFNLRASNNATFRWTRDLTPFAAVYKLAGALIRLQARTSAAAPDPPVYEWVSTNSAHGQIDFNAKTNLCAFVAPEADMARLTGDLVYDCRLEFSGGASIVIFGGRLRFAEGVTRLSSGLSGTSVSGLGDTVSVDGERGMSPVPLPLSLSSTLAACQAAQAASAASAASVTPAGLADALAGLSAAQLAALAAALVAAVPSSALAAAIGAMIQTLPPAPTAGVTTLWSDGGIPVVSEG